MKSAFIFFTLLIFSGCEYNYNYKYSVKNNTDTVITLHMRTYQGDQFFQLASQSVTEVFYTTHGVEGRKGPYFGDVDKDLFLFDVKKGTILSSKNYLKNNAWVFSGGKYSTVIDSTEF